MAFRVFPVSVLLSLLFAVPAAFLAAPPVRAQVGAACTLDGSALPEGGTQMFYSARSVPRGQSCDTVGQVRQCADGVLSGTDAFRYGDCIELEEFLGVNTNRRPADLSPDLVARTGADWVRSNVSVLEYKRQKDGDGADPNWDFADWDIYIDAAAGPDRKAILNLMWDFRKFGRRPPKPGSDRERKLFDYLDREILDKLAPHVEILVTGNEPFVNTDKRDWEEDPAYGGIPLVVFYTRVTEHVHDYLVRNGLRDRVDLYMGAFTRLHTEAMQTQPAVAALLAYADAAPHVDGIDMHTHVVNVPQIDRALAFARTFTGKPIIVTEFTFVWKMKQAVESGDRLGAAFAGRWGRDANETAGDYMACEVFGQARGCKGQGPVSKAEWDDFFATRDWYIDHFITEADAVFRRYAVRGATFGLVQKRPTKRQLSPDRPPWYMGFLFVPAAVAPGPGGAAPPNYQYLDDFLAIQRARAGAGVH